MEQRATALIRKILILTYIMKWIESERHMLGEISSIVVDQIHKNVLAEILYLKMIMRRNGVRVIDQESQPKDIWVNFIENNITREAFYPKVLIIPDVSAHLKLTLQELVKGCLNV